MAAWQNAQLSLRAGRHAAAQAGYRDLVQFFPGVTQLWLELGSAAAGDLDFAQADEAFRRAMELSPNDAVLLVSIGTQFYHMRRLEQASACFKRAVAADPSSFDARMTLASWLERNHRLDEAWEYAETCLAQRPKDGRILYFKAYLLQCKGLNKEAETALRNLITGDPSLSLDVRFNATHLLGIVLDALGQYEEAFSHFSKAKTLRRQMADTGALERAYDKMNGERREVLAALTPEMLRRWREESAATPCPHPLAFLGGAPRSGTTLIEQILGSHPEILVFDELDSFRKEVLGPLCPSPPARRLTAESLDSLAAAGRAQMTGRYFKSLLRETGENPGARLLLDKNPATMPWLHVWLRFFPQSKVVVALRDPRDIVISSYFQNLPFLTLASVNFFSLERTARYYSDCMDAWLRVRELGGFDWIETRYEDVVGNLEGEGRRITNFLGLPWHEGQATYYETARRKYLDAPTYNDVTKPIYTRAMGRWEHYAEALAPLQEGLAKYCRTFGYG
ncbi:MAG: tetratricopeptide repeat-containing sulfotransferase family protein [Limisphaerales bacterium]